MKASYFLGRKLDWLRDHLPIGVPDSMQTARLLGDDPAPAISSNGDLVLSILEQGQEGSCVGNGTAQAGRCEMVRAGAPSPALGSRLWIYYLARAYDHDTANDDGTQIHQAFAAIVKYGLPPEEVWPYSDDTRAGAPFSRMPPPEAWQAAFDAKFALKAHRITSSGYARVDDVKRALGQRRVVVFGTDVSEDFCAGNFDPTVPLDPPIGKRIAGGHCRVYVDHDDRGARVVNSWGADWGAGGYSIDSWDYVTWENTDDLWVFDSMPKTLGGAP